MKCPSCFSVMSNRDERHDIGNGKIRMNLHCWNKNCPAHLNKQAGYYSNYVQVGCLPDIWAGPWEMRQYGFVLDIGPWYLKINHTNDRYTNLATNIPENFRKKDLSIYPDKFKYRSSIPSVAAFSIGHTITTRAIIKPTLFNILIHPVNLSTGDHMHEEVWDFVNQHYDVERANRLGSFA